MNHLEELIALAKKEGVDLKGYKHVIEISGIRHSEKRHGKQSKDREPLSIEDYLLVPFAKLLKEDEQLMYYISYGTNGKSNLEYIFQKISELINEEIVL